MSCSYHYYCVVLTLLCENLQQKEENSRFSSSTNAPVVCFYFWFLGDYQNRAHNPPTTTFLVVFLDISLTFFVTYILKNAGNPACGCEILCYS